MPPALIFDLDGTLVDSLPGIAASLNRALAAAGLSVHPSARVRNFIGDGSLELARRALPPGSPAGVAHEIEAAFKSDYALSWPEGTTPYPGITDLLGTLGKSGRPLAVLSNKPHSFTVEIVDRLFPGHRFDPVVGQVQGTPHKPAPDSALAILNRWDLPPADARFIGDSTVDRTTADNAGIPFVGVAWGYHDPVHLGPLLAGTPAELASLLA